MKMRQLLGIVFIVLGVGLIFAAVGQLGKIVLSVAEICKLLSGGMDMIEAGRPIGRFIYWIFHFYLIHVLIKYGKKWTKAKPKIEP